MNELENMIDRMCDFVMSRHGCDECPLRGNMQGDLCEKYYVYNTELGYEYGEEEQDYE
jgi:hypothetical protein